MENEQPLARGWPIDRIKTEGLLFLGLIALGMWLVPALIFLVGNLILGPYGDFDTLASFYIDLFGSLLVGRGIAWLLVSSPYLFLSLIRLLIWFWRIAQRAASRKKALVVEQADL